MCLRSPSTPSLVCSMNPFIFIFCWMTPFSYFADPRHDEWPKPSACSTPTIRYTNDPFNSANIPMTPRVYFKPNTKWCPPRSPILATVHFTWKGLTSKMAGVCGRLRNWRSLQVSSTVQYLFNILDTRCTQPGKRFQVPSRKASL